MANIFSKIKHHYKDIPNKKPYIEFLAALLTIPVLLTVIMLNLGSLRGDKENKTTNTVKPETIIVTVPGGSQNITNPTKEPCTPGIGEVVITSPEEGEEVIDNPTNININYQRGEYCEVVWSYRINSGKWSDYDDKSIALYSLPKGNIKLDLRVKSVVSSDTESMSRNFIYQGESIVPTSPVSSSSAN